MSDSDCQCIVKACVLFFSTAAEVSRVSYRGWNGTATAEASQKTGLLQYQLNFSRITYKLQSRRKERTNDLISISCDTLASIKMDVQSQHSRDSEVTRKLVRQISQDPEKLVRYDLLFKVVLLGDARVGKTSLLKRFVENTFTSDYINTIGVDFKTKLVSLKEKTIKLQIW